MRAGSNLEKVLESGQFAVTAELGPPQSSDPEPLRKLARLTKGVADAYNVTDNITAIVRLSSVASAAVLLQEGLEPVLQVTCRDRNRIALQSDLIGAAALGVKNVLCLTGDHIVHGNEKGARPVYDLDAITLVQMYKNLRDTGKFLGGDVCDEPPKILIGAAANPFAEPTELRVLRLAKKVAAGADFIQSQGIYDLRIFEQFMDQVRDRGLDRKVHILAGLIPVKGPKMATFMRENVPGVVVPDGIIDRLKKATDTKAEGFKLCLEQIEYMRSFKGIHGVHIMAVRWEEIVPRLIQEAGLLPRPHIA